MTASDEKPAADHVVLDLREKIARLEERQAQLRWLFATLLGAAVGLSALSNFVFIPNTVNRQFTDRQVEGVIQQANGQLKQLQDAAAALHASYSMGVAKDGDLVKPPSLTPDDWMLFLGAVESRSRVGGGADLAADRTADGWKIRAQLRQAEGEEPVKAQVHYLLLPVANHQ